MSDNVNNGRIAKNTLMLYLRMFVSLAISLYTSRVVLQTLGVDDYGVYNVVGGIIVMLGAFTDSLAGTSSRFITYELGAGDKVHMGKVFGNVVSLHLISAVAVLALAETVGLWFLNTQLQIPAGREDAAFWVYQLSVFAAIVSIVSVPYHAAVIAHERMGAFAYLTILDEVLKLCIVYLIVTLPFDHLIVYASLIFLVQVLDCVIVCAYSTRNFEESRMRCSYDKGIFSSIFKFSLWTTNGSLAVFGYTQGLNILLNMFFGPAVNAARGIAVQVQGVCMQFCNNFQMALNPQLTKSYAQGCLDDMHSLIVRSSKFSYFILLFLVLPLMYESPFVLRLWLGAVPDHTVNFLRLILVSGLLYTLSNPIITSVHATGNVKRFQMVEATMLLCIVPVSWFLLKCCGVPPEAVFLVHVVVEMMTQIVRLYIVCPMIKLSKSVYVAHVVRPVALVTVLSPVFPCLVCSLRLPEPLSFFAVCVACVLSCATTAYLVGCTSGEREFLKLKVRGVLTRMVGMFRPLT